MSRWEFPRQNRDAIVELLNSHGACEIRVFGSVARGEDDGRSDIDLLVDLPAGASAGSELQRRVWVGFWCDFARKLVDGVVARYFHHCSIGAARDGVTMDLQRDLSSTRSNGGRGVSAASATTPAKPSVQFDRAMPGVAVITLNGAHDLATWPEVLRALQRSVAVRDVLVDLSGCTRIDPTILGGIVEALGRLPGSPAVLDVVLPPHNDALRIYLEQNHVAGDLALHHSRPHALAEIVRRASGVATAGSPA